MHIFRRFFGQTHLRNSIAMATNKIRGDQKLFEMVCYMLKLKVTKFQLPRPNGFWAIFKKPAGGKICPAVQNRVNPIRPGGPRGPDGQTHSCQSKNLLSYDAQTWWLLVFILETPFGHILAKLVNQGGCCCSFLIKTSQKFWNEKFFLCLKIAEIYKGVNFGSRRTILDIKTHFFKVKPVFRG